MRKCIVCNSEMHQGFVDKDTGNLWCDEICLRIDYTAEEQKAAYRENGGGLYWTEWEFENPCKRCEGAEQADGHEFCHECIHEMITPGYSAPFFSEELEMEIRRANGC